MKTEITRILLALLRSAISGEKLTAGEKSLYSSEILPQLTVLAKKHDVAHLLAFGLKSNGLLNENDKKLENEILAAVYRCETQKLVLKELCAALEKAKIPFIPLKGAVLRSYYPEPWMRTSCDIDVLVKEADLEYAIDCLAKCDFRFEHRDSHDVTLVAPNGVCIELHYNLIEDNVVNEASTVLSDVWNTAILNTQCQCHYEMPDEMFYFYHIAHMAKHLENGGCGIRSFIDLWILNKLDNSARDKRQKIICKGALSIFESQVRLLSEIWFEKACYTTLTIQLEDYVLHGGVYGSDDNRIIIQQHKQGGRLKYMLFRIFLPYDELKFNYPILEKHRWLTPVMEICRWGKAIFCDRLKRVVGEWSIASNVSENEQAKAAKFLSDLGLNK